jgi:1-acyl-sn-glycerol-3-phosphate acyltransferase
MAKAELFQKDIPKEERIFYYESEEDDPIKTDEQEKKIEVGLPKDYQFIPKNPFTKLYSALLFRAFKVFGQYYERVYWQTKFYGREKLKKAKGKGYVMYANHTNPFHDVFGPAFAADRRIFTIISPVNLKIPGIGKLLPLIGGLPLGKTKAEKAAFNAAVDKRLAQKNALIIYPEAHVWPYYTGIRAFKEVSFKYPVKYDVPIFTCTTTYYKERNKVKIKLFIDGPFYPNQGLNNKLATKELRDIAYNTMLSRAQKENRFAKIKYIRKNKEDGK